MFVAQGTSATMLQNRRTRWRGWHEQQRHRLRQPTAGFTSSPRRCSEHVGLKQSPSDTRPMLAKEPISWFFSQLHALSKQLSNVASFAQDALTRTNSSSLKNVSGCTEEKQSPRSRVRNAHYPRGVFLYFRTQPHVLEIDLHRRAALSLGPWSAIIQATRSGT